MSDDRRNPLMSQWERVQVENLLNMIRRHPDLAAELGRVLDGARKGNRNGKRKRTVLDAGPGDAQ